MNLTNNPTENSSLDTLNNNDGIITAGDKSPSGITKSETINSSASTAPPIIFKFFTEAGRVF